MRTKITRRLILPMLYGALAAWVVAGAVAVVVLELLTSVNLLVAIGTSSAILLLALVPVLYCVAITYSVALKYHKAEYLYTLGNGGEASEAVKVYERKAKRAVSAWLQRKFVKSSFGALPITFLALLMAGVSILAAVEITILVGVVVVLAVGIALYTMLYSARHYCFDKYGNIKNN